MTAPKKDCKVEKQPTQKYKSSAMSIESASDKTKEYKHLNGSTLQEKSTFKFSIAQWNARSTNTQEKLEFVNTFNSIIITLLVVPPPF